MTFRILSISDVHADSRLFGVSRFAEVERAMIESADAAIQRKVDLWMMNGDLCDPDGGVGVFRCVQLALYVDTKLEQAGIPRVWIAGNHDVCEDGSGDTTLSPLLAHQSFGYRTTVFNMQGWQQLGNGLHLLGLPYTAASHAYDPAEYARSTWDRMSDGGRVIVSTHLMIEGVQPGEETKEMSRGRSVLYPTDLIAEKRPVAQIAGHYHARQNYRGIQIVGAPARFAFGERNNDPAFLVIECE